MLRELSRPLVLVAVLILVPIFSFLLFGNFLEGHIEAWLATEPPPLLVGAAVVALLSADFFLPVPSALVSTYAGARMTIVGATTASWLGMSIGALIGFVLARALGRPLVLRMAKQDEVEQLDAMAVRLGAWLLVLTRALPVLSETAVLLLGSTKLSWKRFLVPVGLSNLGIAVAFTLLGHYGRTYNAEFYAMVASIALPLLAATIVRKLMPAASKPTE